MCSFGTSRIWHLCCQPYINEMVQSERLIFQIDCSIIDYFYFQCQFLHDGKSFLQSFILQTVAEVRPIPVLNLGGSHIGPIKKELPCSELSGIKLCFEYLFEFSSDLGFHILVHFQDGINAEVATFGCRQVDLFIVHPKVFHSQDHPAGGNSPDG